ncbi:chymotrypsin-C-like [Anopheles nili]|uniref:chymotrypsin-C-like n=1 Tax=Anopheles nili TaxID=185578 RepID=UPI00237C411E|nr:chymotrypsin-C-like [Anopheles nili]
MVQLSLVIVLLVGAVVGSRAQNTVLRDTLRGEFPSVVNVKTPRVDQECLGVVINANHVLTAAFCVINDAGTHIFATRLVRVLAGDIVLAPATITRQVRDVSHIFVHENYRPHLFENNLAVIRLHAPFHLPSNAIEPVYIRNRIVADNSECDIVRWLRPVAGQPPPATPEIPRQQALNAYVLNRDACGTTRRVQESMICMRPSTANYPTIQGDLMFCDRELVGVMSFYFTDPQQQTQPNLVFTQVRFHTHWIHNQLNRTQPMPPGWNPLE